MAKAYGRIKESLLGELSGAVVEIGPGTGVNFQYYPPGVHVIGIEPNAYMRPYLERSAGTHGLDFTLREGYAEALPLPDASADAVVSTLVLCSVSCLERSLAEVRRVLRPAGRFIFLEHVGAPAGTFARRVQQLVKPLWRRLGDGCCPDRETGAAIERAGFAELRLDHRRIRAGLPLVSRHILGIAVR